MELLVFAVLAGISYLFYKRWMANKGRMITYRRVELKKASEEKVNALVIGGSGTLGKEIIKCLLEDGDYNVHSLDLVIPDETKRNNDVCSYIQADVTNSEHVFTALEGMSVVFHVAGIIPSVSSTASAMYRLHVNGTKNVISVCKRCKVKRLIYTSSVGIILDKDPNQIIKLADESYPLPKNPINAYAETKGIAERSVREANGKDGLLTCILRPGGILDTNMAKKILNCTYAGDGHYKYPWVPLKAAAKGHLLAEKKLHVDGESSVAAGNAYILCISEEFCNKDYIEFSASLQRKEARSVPINLLYILLYFNVAVYWLTGRVPIDQNWGPMTMDYQLRSYTFSSAAAHKELGWEELPPWKDVFRECLTKVMESKQ